MELPIYELKINESLKDESEVSYVALVLEPAIQKEFVAFKFVEPSKGEHESEFIPRCVKYMVDEGKETEQAVAICYSIWEEHFKQDFQESYNDYPKAASENAKIALRWAEENGWGECGTPVGKARANQLANGEGISRETIARMSAFERHRENSQKELGDGCGRLMWLAWGGDEGVEWAKRKLEQIDSKMIKANEYTLDVYGYSPKNFDVCPGAVATFNHLVSMNVGIEEQGMVRSAAQIADSIFEIEKNVIANNVSTLKEVQEVGILIDDFKDLMHEIDELVGMQHDVSYMDGHLVKVKSYLKLKNQLGFQVVNEDQRIISGPLMIADELIYRNNDKFGEHYVKFSADTIKKIAIKFSKKKYQSNVNLMHDPNNKVAGVTMFESWLTDKERGILPMAGFEDVADGSWFGSFYVENNEVWNKVKAGEFRGFSVEGLFDYETPLTKEEEMLNKISELLNAIS